MKTNLFHQSIADSTKTKIPINIGKVFHPLENQDYGQLELEKPHTLRTSLGLMLWYGNGLKLSLSIPVC